MFWKFSNKIAKFHGSRSVVGNIFANKCENSKIYKSLEKHKGPYLTVGTNNIPQKSGTKKNS